MNYEVMLEGAMARLKAQEEELIETKKTINTICKWAGQTPRFGDLEAPSHGAGGGFRRDEFYGQPLSTVVRKILEARKAANQGAAFVTEIYDAMVNGGFKFEAANEDNAKRALRISLTKNTAIFHKLPKGEYGLRAWYPNIKDSKAKEATTEPEAGETNGMPAEEFDFEEKEKAAEAAKSA
jgi:hypothetical protein